MPAPSTLSADGPVSNHQTQHNRRMPEHAAVTTKGARRWLVGHPWIYRSDITQRPNAEPGAVEVHDPRGRPLGWALWSPQSEISLRLLDRNPRARIDAGWWRDAI